MCTAPEHRLKLVAASTSATSK